MLPLVWGRSASTVSLKGCYATAPRIPEAVYALFQMMFAVISPLLITGAVAERMRWVFCPHSVPSVL